MLIVIIFRHICNMGKIFLLPRAFCYVHLPFARFSKISQTARFLTFLHQITANEFKIVIFLQNAFFGPKCRFFKSLNYEKFLNQENVANLLKNACKSVIVVN